MLEMGNKNFIFDLIIYCYCTTLLLCLLFLLLMTDLFVMIFVYRIIFVWLSSFVSSNSFILFTLELASYNLLLASSLYSLQAGRETVWPHDPHTGWSYCVTIPSWVVRPKSRDSDPIVVFKLLIYAKCLIFISCYLLEDTFNIPKELLLPFCVVP